MELKRVQLVGDSLTVDGISEKVTGPQQTIERLMLHLEVMLAAKSRGKMTPVHGDLEMEPTEGLLARAKSMQERIKELEKELVAAQNDAEFWRSVAGQLIRERLAPTERKETK